MKNFMQIAKLADEEFRKKESFETLPEQDFDWCTRYYEACGNVSDEDLQVVWAKILAGEIRDPGSYSLRTLEHLKNLSKEEAMLFLKVCEASVRIGRNVMLPRIDSYLSNKGIIYDDIIKLEDYGLAKADATITTTITMSDGYRILTFNDDWVVIVKKREEGEKEGSQRLEMNEYLFTQSGAELFNVIGINNKRDFSDICDLFRSTYKNFVFERGRIIERNGDHIRYQIIKAE